MESATLPNIAESVIKAKQEKIRNWPHNSNYTYEAGHDCCRYLFYERTAWQDKAPHSVTLQFIFDGGHYNEQQARDELNAAGYHVIREAMPFEWKEFQLRGNVDGFIRVNRDALPAEIKGYSHYAWESINSIDDLIKSDRVWHRLVPPQILLYQMMSENEWGLLYLKSKITYEPKSFWVNLYDHLEYVERILKRLELVNQAIAKNEPPERVDPDLDLCSDCGFFGICKPDAEWIKGADLANDAELLEALELREKLQPMEKEFKNVDQWIRKRVAGREKLVIGEYLVTGKSVTRGGYTVEPGEYWRTTITRIRGAE